MGLESRTSQSPSTPWFVSLSHYGFLTELVLSKIEGFGMTRSGCSAWANFSEIAVAVEERIYVISISTAFSPGGLHSAQ